MRALIGAIWGLDDEHLLTPVAHDRIVTAVVRAVMRELHIARLERRARR